MCHHRVVGQIIDPDEFDVPETLVKKYPGYAAADTAETVDRNANAHASSYRLSALNRP
jgi:hypothetical protein